MNDTHIVMRLPGLIAGIEKRLQGLPEQTPVLVCAGDGSRALVISACAHAVLQGVRPGMRMGRLEGFRGEVVAASPLRYEVGERELADRIGTALPDVEVLRSGVLRTRWSPGRRFLAGHLHQAREILAHEGYRAAWGVGPGDVVAEIAAAVAGVGETVIVEPGDTTAFLARQPVGVLPDLGEEHVHALHEIGVRTLGQIARLPDEVLRSLFGEDGPRLRRVALGGDRGPVPRQWRGWREFDEDTADLDRVRRALADLVAEGFTQVIGTLGRVPQRMQLTLLYSDGRRTGARIGSPRREHEGSWQTRARAELDRIWTRRVRLSEVRLGIDWGGPPAGQLSLLVPETVHFRDRRLTQAVGRVRDRWGRQGVRYAAAG